ncbi:hypothetical protein FRC20_005338 [Serendipita sp. 405]|nr:hypothetical protein FRC20_005338 [Serendipita sp. 405]
MISRLLIKFHQKCYIDSYVIEDLEYYTTTIEEDEPTILSQRHKHNHNRDCDHIVSFPSTTTTGYRRRCRRAYVYEYDLRALPYRHRPGHTDSNSRLSHVDRVANNRDKEKEKENEMPWYDAPTERSFEHVDPRDLERPNAPLFGGEGSDEDEDEDKDGGEERHIFQNRSGIKEKGKWFGRQPSLWIQDIPCIEDEEFEAMLASSNIESQPPSDDEDDDEDDEDDYDEIDGDGGEESVCMLTTREDTRMLYFTSEEEVSQCQECDLCGTQVCGELENSDGSEEIEKARQSRIILFGKHNVRMGFVPSEDGFDSSVWSSVHDIVLGEMGRSRRDFLKPISSHENRAILILQEELGHETILSQRATAGSKSLNRAKSKSKDPLRVRLLSESILNRANKELHSMTIWPQAADPNPKGKRLRGCELRVLESLYELDRI